LQFRKQNEQIYSSFFEKQGIIGYFFRILDFPGKKVFRAGGEASPEDLTFIVAYWK